MAVYKYQGFLEQDNNPVFDAVHQPGASAPYPGIYRCAGCGHEIAIAGGHTLPPQSHHQHTYSQGAIRWQLIVSHRVYS